MLNLIILKFVLIFVLSFLFGLERQLTKKPVGFGTFIFVATGSCALGIAALSLTPENPTPIFGAVVTGIGFLGAGALIKSTDKIFGFTSAASIWIFAIIGLLVGTGEFIEAFLTYAIVWIVILVDINLEARGIGNYNKKINLTTIGTLDKGRILSLFGEAKVRLISLEINKKTKRSSYVYLITIPLNKIEEITENLNSTKWIESFHIE